MNPQDVDYPVGNCPGFTHRLTVIFIADIVTPTLFSGSDNAMADRLHRAGTLAWIHFLPPPCSIASSESEILQKLRDPPTAAQP